MVNKPPSRKRRTELQLDNQEEGAVTCDFRVRVTSPDNPIPLHLGAVCKNLWHAICHHFSSMNWAQIAKGQ
jgi:hypothetical protein